MEKKKNDGGRDVQRESYRETTDKRQNKKKNRRVKDLLCDLNNVLAEKQRRERENSPETKENDIAEFRQQQDE